MFGNYSVRSTALSFLEFAVPKRHALACDGSCARSSEDAETSPVVASFQRFIIKQVLLHRGIHTKACLQAYLRRFKLADTPICPSCGIEPESTTHYLLYCITYTAQRRRLRRSLGRDKNLGLEILGDKKTMKSLMAYINDTKQFEDSHGNLQPMEHEDEEC